MKIIIITELIIIIIIINWEIEDELLLFVIKKVQ